MGDFQRFWDHRGGPAAFEAWRQGGPVPSVLVRVVASTFCAGFVISDQVTECAPILRRHVMGKTEAQIRAIIAAKGWRATIVPTF